MDSELLSQELGKEGGGPLRRNEEAMPQKVKQPPSTKEKRSPSKLEKKGSKQKNNSHLENPHKRHKINQVISYANEFL